MSYLKSRFGFVPLLCATTALMLAGTGAVAAQSASAVEYRTGVENTGIKVGLEFSATDSGTITSRINCVRAGVFSVFLTTVYCGAGNMAGGYGAIHTVAFRRWVPGIPDTERASIRAYTRSKRCTFQRTGRSEQPISCWRYTRGSAIN